MLTCVEDKEDCVPKKGTTKRSKVGTSPKRKQPAAKRRKKNSTNSDGDSNNAAAFQEATSSQIGHSLTAGPNLSASSSSSSSEDEFDRIVKNWNENDSSMDHMIAEITSTSTRGQKRTRKRKINVRN